MKIARNGKASALTDQQFQDLLNAAPSPKYRMLWALQRYTAARIGEALQVTWAATAGGRVTFLKATTKTKRTRQVPICPALAAEIDRYRAMCLDVQPGHFLFQTDDSVTQPMSRQAADKQLRKTAALIGVEGISTHSFRRTAAQAAVDKGAAPPRDGADRTQIACPLANTSMQVTATCWLALPEDININSLTMALRTTTLPKEFQNNHLNADNKISPVLVEQNQRTRGVWSLTSTLAFAHNVPIAASLANRFSGRWT